MKIKRFIIIASVFALAGVISYFIMVANEKQFDQTQWEVSPLTRYKMSKNIMESNVLIGKSKTEVITLLGSAIPSTLTGREHLVYSLGKPPSFFEAKKETLVVIFENNVAIKVLHSLE